MGEFRKWGGVSALIEAAAYIFGFGMVLAVLSDVLTSAFGLGFIVWFAWAGIVMLRDHRADEA